MSKLGKKPIAIPEDVRVTLDGKTIKVIGPKGELDFYIRLDCDIKIENNLIQIITKRKDNFSKSLFGMTRSQIKNMIVGVKDGYEKELILVGVGYRVELTNNKLILSVGFSHPIEVMTEAGIEFKVEKNKIKIIGIDKQKVGQMAAKIRAVKIPEPYKGKGIRYSDEIVKKKPGKLAAKAESEGS